jgi:hypothetical protein
MRTHRRCLSRYERDSLSSGLSDCQIVYCRSKVEYERARLVDRVVVYCRNVSLVLVDMVDMQLMMDNVQEKVVC